MKIQITYQHENNSISRCMNSLIMYDVDDDNDEGSVHSLCVWCGVVWLLFKIFHVSFIFFFALVKYFVLFHFFFLVIASCSKQFSTQHSCLSDERIKIYMKKKEYFNNISLLLLFLFFFFSFLIQKTFSPETFNFMGFYLCYLRGNFSFFLLVYSMYDKV